MKLLAIVGATISVIFSVFLYAKILPNFQKQIEDLTIYEHKIDVGEFSVSNGGSTLKQNYYIRVYNHSKEALTSLSDITGQNIYYCDYLNNSSGAVNIDSAVVNINTGKIYIKYGNNYYNSTISAITDTISQK